MTVPRVDLMFIDPGSQSAKLTWNLQRGPTATADIIFKGPSSRSQASLAECDMTTPALAA